MTHRKILRRVAAAALLLVSPLAAAEGSPGPKGLPPAVPAAPTATDGDFIDRVGVTWTASAGATGYELYR
ncbi:MAG: hypothetical protein AAGE01_12545 [Pseudomonadota bacterium]